MSDNFTRWRQEEEQHLLATYSKFPFALARGKGMYVYDVDGKAYLDFYGGHAVAIIGHCHPRWVAAVAVGFDVSERWTWEAVAHWAPEHTETFRREWSTGEEISRLEEAHWTGLYRGARRP